MIMHIPRAINRPDVYLLQQWFEYSKGGVTYEGSIVCPSYDELCAVRQL